MSSSDLSLPGLLQADDSVLVVVDIQERLCAAMMPDARDTVVRNARILLQAAGRLGVPVLATEQYPKGLGPTLAEVAELLPEGTPRAEKTRFSVVGAVAVPDRAQIVLAGMESHVCVLQSALEFCAEGYQVFVVEDACCSRTERNHGMAMERLQLARCVVTSTEAVVFEWLRDARHAQFKAISALVR